MPDNLIVTWEALDGLVTKTYPIEGINQGYDDMNGGKNIRGVLVYEH